MPRLPVGEEMKRFVEATHENTVGGDKRVGSIEFAKLAQCGGLKILIGKNNAGKSNILSAIELVILHLKQRRIAGPWHVSRPQDEFTNRDLGSSVRIGIEFELPVRVNAELRECLAKEAPHLERSI